MKPLAALAPSDVAGLRGVLFDLDDTLLSHGALTRDAYDSLFLLRDAGLRLVAVTGRPASWGELVARQWPIDAAVTENGAVSFAREGRFIERVDPIVPAERQRRRMRLATLVQTVREKLPEVRLADDIEGRISDMAWDIGERVKLDLERIEALAAIVRDAGARTTRSSVHLHATFDGGDKASGAVRLLGERFREDASACRGRYAYLGDSLNDAPCFSAFRLTFGVANVRAYVGRLALPPRFVAGETMGAGFAQIARAIVANLGSSKAGEQVS